MKLVAKDLALAKVEDASCDWDLADVDGFSVEIALLLECSGSGGSSGWPDPDPPDPPVSALPWVITIPPPTTPPPPPRLEEPVGSPLWSIIVEDAVAAVAVWRGKTGMVVSLLNAVSGTISEDVPLAIPALDVVELFGESLLVSLEVSVRLTSKPLLPEVSLFGDVDLVKLPSGTADPVGADDDKEVELTLM